MMFHGVFGLPDKSGSRSILLPAASSAAVTLLAVNADDHMTHFTRGIVCAVNDLAVDNDTGADARAECDRHKIL